MSGSDAVGVRGERGAAPARVGGTPRQRGVAAGRALNVLLPVLSLIALFALWQAAVVNWRISSYVFPRVDTTLASLRDHWPDIWSNLLVTLGQAGIGFVAGNLLAVAGATLFVSSPLAERAFFPLAVVIQTIPIIVWSPILVIAIPDNWWPAFWWPQIVIAVLISFFPALVNMTRGLRAVDPLALELFHVLHASRWQVYRKLRWPSALPALFTSLRITSTLSLIGAVVGEYVAGGGAGSGYEIQLAKSSIDTAQVVAITLVVSVTGVVVFLAVAGLERLVLAWRGQSV